MNRFANWICLVAVPAVAWVAALETNARTADEARSGVNLRELLLSDDEEQVASAIKEFKRIRSEQVAQLSEIVADVKLQRSSSSAVSQAIAILGEIRSEESIGVLVENIAFPYWIDGKETMLHAMQAIGTPPDFPAVKALIRIGPAAIVPVAKKLAICSASYEYEACELAIRNLRGDRNSSLIRQAMDIAHKNAISEQRRNRMAYSRWSLDIPPPRGSNAASSKPSPAADK